VHSAASFRQRRYFAKVLESLGISELEERAYDALLGHGGSSAGELSQTLALNPTAARKLLASLEAKGLVTRSAAGSRRWTATDPEIALEVLILRRREDLERLRLSIPELIEKHRARRSHGAAELVEIVTGREAVARWFVQLQLSARTEILSLDRPPYVTPMVNELELELLGRGIRYRAIYDPEALEIPGELDVLRQVMAAGEQARTVSGLPAKLVIADDRLALMPIRADDPAAGSVVVHGSSLLETLRMFFESLWSQAAPIRFDGSDLAASPDEARADRLPAQVERILPLLAAGLTDRAIAGQLELSPRTFDRRMRELMDALHARTRFQAGALAARRGWLGHDE
jgi:sugar-specific transcriptional regulator TrmB/DNA-binding CsgD family transcriptional regulator